MSKNQSVQQLEILYQDEQYIAVHKPAGIHVHPTQLSRDEDSCMRILRDQLDRWVYTVHRLDRATSGVLLFALSSETAAAMINLFSERKIEKEYWAVVRGFIDEKGSIERPLREEKHKAPAEAITHFQRRRTVELPFPVGKFNTARYSLVSAFPKTGRKNQLRKHFSAASHHIIGDTRYGDGRHNRLFREKFNSHRLLLLAVKIGFIHPFSGEAVSIAAQPDSTVSTLFQELGWGDIVLNK